MLRLLLIITFIIILTNCNYYIQKNPSIIIDNNMKPYGASQQLMPTKWRGEVGLITTNVREFPNETAPDYDMVKNKSWIVDNWGLPDETKRKNGIDYLIYNKKNKNAPHYDMQFCNGLNPVKVGYKNNKLVYIEAFFPNNPSWIKGPVYYLPK